MVFLDSNIIIYLSKKYIDVEDVLRADEEYVISVITYMEILSYGFQSIEEEAFIKQLLYCFNIVYIDATISDKVIEIKKNYKIKLPDAIICASAIVNNAMLMSNDTKLKAIKALTVRPVELKK